MWGGEDGKDFARIFIEGQNKSGRHKKHLKTHAKRLLCDGCVLRNNTGPIKCNGVDPDRISAESAYISNPTPLSKTYWDSLFERLPCSPQR